MKINKPGHAVLDVYAKDPELAMKLLKANADPVFTAALAQWLAGEEPEDAPKVLAALPVVASEPEPVLVEEGTLEDEEGDIPETEEDRARVQALRKGYLPEKTFSEKELTLLRPLLECSDWHAPAPVRHNLRNVTGAIAVYNLGGLDFILPSFIDHFHRGAEKQQGFRDHTIYTIPDNPREVGVPQLKFARKVLYRMYPPVANLAADMSRRANRADEVTRRGLARFEKAFEKLYPLHDLLNGGILVFGLLLTCRGYIIPSYGVVKKWAGAQLSTGVKEWYYRTFREQIEKDPVWRAARKAKAQRAEDRAQAAAAQAAAQPQPQAHTQLLAAAAARAANALQGSTTEQPGLMDLNSFGNRVH